MKMTTEFYATFGILSQLCSRIKVSLEEFEKLPKNPALKYFVWLETAYLYFILVDISKLLGLSRADRSGLKQFVDLLPSTTKKNDFETQIKGFLSDPICQKISLNRDKFICHLDTDYMNIPFSRVEIDVMIKKFTDFCNLNHMQVSAEVIQNFESMVSTKSDIERFTISDLRAELGNFSSLVQAIEKLLFEINLHYYSLPESKI